MKKKKIGHQVKEKKNPQCRLFCFCKERDRQVLPGRRNAAARGRIVHRRGTLIQMDESSWAASQSAVGGRAELSSHTQTHTRTHAHAPRTAGFIFLFLTVASSSSK